MKRKTREADGRDRLSTAVRSLFQCSSVDSSAISPFRFFATSLVPTLRAVKSPFPNPLVSRVFTPFHINRNFFSSRFRVLRVFRGSPLPSLRAHFSDLCSFVSIRGPFSLQLPILQIIVQLSAGNVNGQNRPKRLICYSLRIFSFPNRKTNCADNVNGFSGEPSRYRCRGNPSPAVRTDSSRFHFWRVILGWCSQGGTDLRPAANQTQGFCPQITRPRNNEKNNEKYEAKL